MIGLFKTELIKLGDPGARGEQVEIATLEYVDWFNHRRLFEACGDIPPAEPEHAHYRQPARPRRGLPLNPIGLQTRRGDSLAGLDASEDAWAEHGRSVGGGGRAPAKSR
jgi:hypothetical protein